MHRYVCVSGTCVGCGADFCIVSETSWNHVTLRAPHQWENDVTLYVEVSDSSPDSPPVVVARVALIGRLSLVTSWQVLARRILYVLGRDGLHVRLEVPEPSILERNGIRPFTILRDEVWDCLGGRTLNKLHLSIGSSCIQCGSMHGLTPFRFNSAR